MGQDHGEQGQVGQLATVSKSRLFSRPPGKLS